MLLVVGIPILSLLTVAEATGLRNVTIDDSYGDEITHNLPTYTPSSVWTSGAARAQPNASLAYNGTWHDTTSHPGEAAHVVSFDFTGVSLYAYCIIANTPPPSSKYFDTFADYSFLLDGDIVGKYQHEVDETYNFLYDTPVYVNQTMENVLHHFSLVINSTERAVLLLFDYAVYTTVVEDTKSTTSDSSQKSSTGLPYVASGAEHRSNAGGIVGSVLGAIAFVSCIGVLLVIRRQRKRRIDPNFHNESNVGMARGPRPALVANLPVPGPGPAHGLGRADHKDEIRELQQTIQNLRVEKRGMRAALVVNTVPQTVDFRRHA